MYAALTFGVVPQQSPLILIKSWTPVIQYLEKETGQKIDLKIESSISKFEEVLYSGGYDIAYMNPYHYIVANEKKGYNSKIRDEEGKSVPSWLEIDAAKFAGKVLQNPNRDVVDFELNEALIVEFYSR